MPKEKKAIETTEEKKVNWFDNLISRLNTLGEELGLDDSGTKKMRDFVVDNAREQYKAGNRSGIHWAFGQAAKRNVEQVAVAA